MTQHSWSIDGIAATLHALREALALHRQTRKRRSVLEYERCEEERNARAVGAAIRKAIRALERERAWIRVRPKAVSGRRVGVTRCRRFEVMTGMVMPRPSHVGRDGLSSFHFKWTGRGLGTRRKDRSRTYRSGEAVRHVRYILRAGAREIIDGGIVSNISLDPDVIASVFSAIEELESCGRANANVYISLVISLPHELSSAQREALLTRICAIFGREDLPFAGVLHAPDPNGDSRNTHAHVIFSLRPFRVDEDGSFSFEAGTKADLNDKGFIHATRSAVANLINEAMIEAGHSRRFTALNNRERGLAPKSKQEGKSTPGRKHRDRRRESLDLMPAEVAFRRERVAAISALRDQLERVRELVSFDRQPVLAALRERALQQLDVMRGAMAEVASRRHALLRDLKERVTTPPAAVSPEASPSPVQVATPQLPTREQDGGIARIEAGAHGSEKPASDDTAASKETGAEAMIARAAAEQNAARERAELDRIAARHRSHPAMARAHAVVLDRLQERGLWPDMLAIEPLTDALLANPPIIRAAMSPGGGWRIRTDDTVVQAAIRRGLDDPEVKPYLSSMLDALTRVSPLRLRNRGQQSQATAPVPVASVPAPAPASVVPPQPSIQDQHRFRQGTTLGR